MRAALFYGALSIPIVLCALIVVPHYVLFNDDLPGTLIRWAVQVSPVVTGDLSLFNEITPAIIAAGMIAFMPADSKQLRHSAIFIAFCGYLSFIFLSIFLSGPGDALLQQNWDGQELVNARSTILKFVSNVRLAALATAGSMLGFKLKS